MSLTRRTDAAGRMDATERVPPRWIETRGRIRMKGRQMSASKYCIAWLFLVASVLAGGCLVQSLRPFYSSSQIIKCPQAEGDWTLTRDFGRSVTNAVVEPWKIAGSTNQPGKYTINTVAPGSAVTSSLEVVFFSAGGQTYCDVTAESNRGENKYWNATTERVHMLGRVEFTNDVMKVEMLKRDWITSARTNGTITLDAVSRGHKALLVTAQDFDWQKFLEKYADVPGVFTTNAMFEFKRR